MKWEGSRGDEVGGVKRGQCKLTLSWEEVLCCVLQFIKVPL